MALAENIEEFESDEATTTLAALDKLQRDLVTGARTLRTHEARFLVDLYYQAQTLRITLAHQERTAGESREPHALLAFFGGQFAAVEGQIKRALASWVENFEESRWALSVCGIGPVLAAGLRAHVDVSKATSPSKLWAYFGLAPGVKWEKGQKRPWNADAKTLAAFKIGESFVKVKGRPQDFYGKLYDQRKAYEQRKNEAGDYADQAAESLPRFSKSTEAYKHYEAGRLPPARIHARARRWVVKLFLCHYWQVSCAAHGIETGTGPYVKDHMHHADMIPPPNWPLKPAAKPERRRAPVQMVPTV